MGLHHPSSQTVQGQDFIILFLTSSRAFLSYLTLTFHRWRVCLIYLHNPHCTRIAWSVLAVVQTHTGLCWCLCSTPAAELTFLPEIYPDDLLPLPQCATTLEIKIKTLLKHSKAIPMCNNEHTNRLRSRMPASAPGLVMGMFLFINTRTSGITLGFSALGYKGTCAISLLRR